MKGEAASAFNRTSLKRSTRATRAPGYFDGCPTPCGRERNPLAGENQKGPDGSPRKAFRIVQDKTGNVQLYMPELEQAPLRMDAPLAPGWRGVKGGGGVEQHCPFISVIAHHCPFLGSGH
jgi:hypothetical protein